MSEARVGDIGTPIVLTVKEDGVVVDLSTVTVRKIKFKKPSGMTMYKDAVFTTTGVDGKIQYVTAEASDLDEIGIYTVMGYVEFSSGKWHTSEGAFTVRQVI